MVIIDRQACRQNLICKRQGGIMKTFVSLNQKTDDSFFFFSFSKLMPKQFS